MCVYGFVLAGFLQIAMVFARTGQMDRAVDLTRRALYCYECAFIEVTAHHLLFFFTAILSSFSLLFLVFFFSNFVNLFLIFLS